MAINLLNELTKKKLFNIISKLFEKTHDALAQLDRATSDAFIKTVRCTVLALRDE